VVWGLPDGQGELDAGLLGCACSLYPVVSGIAVLHVEDAAKQAAAQVEGGRTDLALKTLLNLTGEQAEAFGALQARPDATYRDAIAAMGLGLEGAYFVHRFSDPSYVVAHALVRAVASTVLGNGGRAIDICGGSGHLTRTLVELSPEPPVLADLYFAKLWLARRFVAPGCEAVCCNANHPLPFARGAFRYAMCADAFMFVWPKRRFVGELLRLIAGPSPSAAVISHTHNQLVWSPSHGQTLSPNGYRALFETLSVRVFGESGLFDDVVNDRPLDLSRRDDQAMLERDPALVLVAANDPRVYESHPLHDLSRASGSFVLNPLYVVEPGTDDEVCLRLQFPSESYEDEFGHCRAYLPAAVTMSRASFLRLSEGTTNGEILDLARRRVVLPLPTHY
jgi:hypothetical protein